MAEEFIHDSDEGRAEEGLAVIREHDERVMVPNPYPGPPPHPGRPPGHKPAQLLPRQMPHSGPLIAREAGWEPSRTRSRPS